MKEKLLETVQKIREDNIDLKETPVYFRWVYEEEPLVEFRMIIREMKTEDEQVDVIDIVH